MNLQFDLNEVVSKEIQEEISGLEKQISTLQESNSKYYQEIKVLTSKIDDSKLIIGLFEKIRKSFELVDATKETSDTWAKSKQENRVYFIEAVLKNIFNVVKEQNGWYHEGGIQTHLAVNYYHNKDIVIDVVKMLIDDNAKIISFIRDYKMPYDYDKLEVVKYVSNPHYCTNGLIFGINRYWMKYGAGKQNMPHDLIMKSPFIIEDDVFKILIDTINKRGSNFYYLYEIAKYNSLSDAQLHSLGETLIGMPVEKLKYEEIKSFIVGNLKKFNDKTLDFFYTLTRCDNHYNTLHWENFPYTYQKKFLMAKDFDSVFNLLSHYSCKWTGIEKQEFFKEYTNSDISQVS